MDKYSFLGNIDINTVEKIYQQYKEDPESVEPTWVSFFKGFEFARENYADEVIVNGGKVDKEFKVINLINAYRQRGHFFTKTNPVRARRKYFPTLDIENFGLSKNDLATEFQAGSNISIGKAPLKSILSHLQQTYCQSIGVEYVFVRKPEIVQWLQNKMEKSKNTPKYTAEERKHIFFHLKLAVGFESFIHKKFIGQKRFSLEGAESLIPALNAVIERGADMGIQEFIIGMPHRGRLNVLANTLQKPYENIFQEFVGKQYDEHIAFGDVKYHLGYGKTITTDTNKKVRLNLAPNPSHLETVGSIIQGIAKAKIYHKYKKDYSKIAPILIHGDAAIAAQGIVYEIIQMSQLDGYKTGGTIHLVINNQVGFTTNYLDARSSTYCTDIAKVTRSPVFHVNGDDPEALMYTITLAMEYRQTFQSDVFIDLLCYRKYGHNEGDEPRFTQPVLYKAIAKHPNTRDLYADKLIDEGILSKDDVKLAIKDFNEILEEKFEKSKKIKRVHIKQFLEEDWGDYSYPEKDNFFEKVNTKVNKEKLLKLANKITNLPEGKNFFKKIVKLIEDRKKMVNNDRLDWSLGEQLAYASLLTEGHPVRISGQDVERGTFSHRHAALVMEDTDEKYFPLKHIDNQQAPFYIFNSHLSEYGVLGFEYGHALANPQGLTIWEAQFGDFHNVAQAIIDQYISSAEEKWGLMNGLVLYLPHGYEGQGPEHSSARVERFLSLAVNENMQVVNCSTPANLFHALRRQMKRKFQVPLVIFTPKSLLRHPRCVSTITDLAHGHFHEIIDDDYVDVNDVKRVVFCTGKIYYDLVKRKEELDAKDIALIRIEQLHPFPTEQITKLVDRYQDALLHLWVQEEPENMGAWRYMRDNFPKVALELVGRTPAGSPASGLHHIHTIRQQEIIDKVFRRCTCELKNKYCGLQCVEGKSREEIKKQYRYLFETT